MMTNQPQRAKLAASEAVCRYYGLSLNELCVRHIALDVVARAHTHTLTAEEKWFFSGLVCVRQSSSSLAVNEHRAGERVKALYLVSQKILLAGPTVCMRASVICDSWPPSYRPPLLSASWLFIHSFIHSAACHQPSQSFVCSLAKPSEAIWLVVVGYLLQAAEIVSVRRGQER